MASAITLHNDFHNAEATVRVPESGLLSQSQAARADRKLCGVSGCTCGGIRRDNRVRAESLDHVTGKYIYRVKV